MIKKTLLKFWSFAVLLTFSVSGAAFADDAQLMTMVRNMQQEMQEMRGVIEQQSAQIRALQSRPGTEVPAPADFKSGLEKELGKNYKWLKDLKFKGDLRLRYEGLQETGSGASADRNRFRYRLRFGFEKSMNGPFEGDKMKVGFRLVSGASGERTSTNTTLDEQFSYKDIAIDRAYASYLPGILNTGTLESEITGGKFENPFLDGSTWVLFDSDVTPEGLYEKFDFKALDSEGFDAGLSFTAGQLILDESGSSDNNDAELWAYQAGLGTEIDAGLENPLKTKHAVSYYDFRDFVNGNFGSAGNNFTSGGRLAAENFYVVDFYNEIGTEIPGLAPFKLYFDWLQNLGENAPGKTLGEGQDKAWLLGAKLGSAKKKGEWELKYEYAWIEANAVPGVFTDSDFGGTDRRGSVLKAAYALTDHLAVNGALFLTNRILTGNPNIDDRERDLVQVDLVWKI